MSNELFIKEGILLDRVEDALTQKVVFNDVFFEKDLIEMLPERARQGE